MHVFILPQTTISRGRAQKIHDDLMPIKKPLNEIPGNDNKNANKNDVIIIDPNLKKADGNPVTPNDLPDDIAFGNGITVLGGLHLKNDERVACVFFVFEDTVGINLAQLRTIEST